MKEKKIKKKVKELKVLRGKINVRSELSIFACWKLVFAVKVFIKKAKLSICVRWINETESK